MLSDDDVHRGPVWAKLGVSGAAALRRVALEVVLARMTGEGELEDAAMAKLAANAERDVTWQPAYPYLFRQAVADMARELSRHVDLDLSDLSRSLVGWRGILDGGMSDIPVRKIPPYPTKRADCPQSFSV